MHALAGVKRHYRALMIGGGAMLVVIGALQVSGIWTALMERLQSRFGGTELPL
jgi:cytochrome c-type biogenesis protein